MSAAPLTHLYNLGRLGQGGDHVLFEADAGQRAAIATAAGLVSLESLAVTVDLKKTSPSRFLLAYRIQADPIQACVVTLAPVPAHIDHSFQRELHLAVARRPAPEAAKPTDLDLSELEEDEPEEIESPHYDLAGPALEEFFLSLDPYPRCPGVEFDPAQIGSEPRQSPFHVLKSLKSNT